MYFDPYGPQRWPVAQSRARVMALEALGSEGECSRRVPGGHWGPVQTMQGANLAELRARTRAAMWVGSAADKINHDEQAQRALCNIKNAFKQEVYTRERRPEDGGALEQRQANEWMVQGLDVGRGPVKLRQPPQIATCLLYTSEAADE